MLPVARGGGRLYFFVALWSFVGCRSFTTASQDLYVDSSRQLLCVLVNRYYSCSQSLFAFFWGGGSDSPM